MMSSSFKVVKIRRTQDRLEEVVLDPKSLSIEKQLEVTEYIRGVLENLVRLIIGVPDVSVEVTYKKGERTTQFFVECPKAYRGRVLGSKGATIDSLRVVVGAMMGVNQMRAVIEVLMPEEHKAG